ncbi:hypothetical protein ACOMHN_043851 [Nucella lapillus]
MSSILSAAAASLPIFIYFFQSVVCLAQPRSGNGTAVTPAVRVKVEGEVVRDGVEEEVLGPLRVWHIVFIVGVVISIAVTICCCCVEWRLPRTRQEIEETYRRRQLNQKYLHQLERTPDFILRNNNNDNNNSGNNDSSNTSSNIYGEDNNIIVDRTRAHRHQHQQEQEHHHHPHPHQHQQPSRVSHHSQQDQQRQTRHPNYIQSHHHNHHQHQNNAHTAAAVDTSSSPGNAARGVAVTEASGRLDRVPKSHMVGVKTPFQLSALTALQKHRQGQGRNQPQQQQQQQR